MNADVSRTQRNIGLATYHAARAEMLTLGLALDERDLSTFFCESSAGAFFCVLATDERYWVAGEQLCTPNSAGEFMWNLYYAPIFGEVSA